ncbi:MAG: hypothetical protein P4K83_01085 [Terracidiphilus sp.]|nr:hypothetical protein [Terracidiphilus sp.]
MDAKVSEEFLNTASAIILAAAVYLFAKWKEREADWRKWKYDKYANLVVSMSGVAESHPTWENRLAFAKAVNDVQLIASPRVSDALQAVLKDLSNNTLLSELIWEIRRDLGVSLRFGFWQMGKRDQFKFELMTPRN